MTLSKLVFPAWMIRLLSTRLALVFNWKISLHLLLPLLIEQEIVETKAKAPRKALQLNSLPLDTSSYAKRTRKRFLIMKRPKNEISIRSQLNEFYRETLVCSFIVRAFNTKHESSCFIQIGANGPSLPSHYWRTDDRTLSSLSRPLELAWSRRIK